jgi:Peptidase family M1 domain
MKWILTLIASFAAIAAAAADSTYTALRAARPDGRTIAVSDFAFDRDVYHVTLNGTLHLLAPVDGKTVGAVFTGRGAYELKPATEVERKTLAVNAADPALQTLRDDFDSMTIFDAALIDQLSKKSPPVKGAAAPEATDAYEKFLAFERKDLKENLHIRVLQALLNGETKPPFLAFPAGKKFPRVLLIVDDLGNYDGEETALVSADSQRGGMWYSAHLRGEQPHGVSRLAQAAHYAIDTTFVGGNRDEMSGVTIVDAMSETDGLRVLPLRLDRRLRVEEVASAKDAQSQSWTPVAFVQENEKEDGDLAVVLPSALKQGDSFFLRLKYRGREVLKDAGDGNFYVQSREAWYPNLGTFSELSTYDLTYRFPKAYQVVSVGEPAGDTVNGDQRVMTFKATEPIRVAGFNVGKFRKISKSDKDTGLTVDVYTNPGTPDIIREINAALESEQGEGLDGHGVLTLTGRPDMVGGPHHISLDTNGLAESAMADAINTSRVANAYFGLMPLKHVSITQQTQFDFGQSWPGLVYLPFMAVLSSTMRANFGLAGASGFLDEVGPHEMAHQWWGHSVGWATYHDEWLSEGFADFTASLVLQQTGGMRKYNDFWETARKYIVTKPPRAFVDNQEAGPIAQGFRLATWRNPSAYQALVYNKGAYVLHMLRLMMQDRSNKENPDAPFIALMSDFVRTYNGKNASTADFKAMVEKHMTPNLNATGNGKMDWYFNEWVYGTAIPKYTSSFDIKPGSEGKFHVSGSIVQAEVPEDFRALVGVYVEFDKGQVFKIAQIPMMGNATRPLDFEVRLPKKPNKIVLNAMHDVLAK